MGDPTIRSVHTVGTIRQHNLVMAGITTSETLAGEQPKDDDLGSRVDELTKQVDELRKTKVGMFEMHELTSEVEKLKKHVRVIKKNVLDSLNRFKVRLEKKK